MSLPPMIKILVKRNQGRMIPLASVWTPINRSRLSPLAG
jgi:hypothetical protein